jgi:L-ascorbate metabolism protein UlaG (beta-lactamase superfamily)
MRYEAEDEMDLIRPVKQGEGLVAEVASTLTAPGSVAIWWLGQSGFLLKSPDATLVIDPYLSEHLTRKYAGTERPHIRMTEAPLRGSDLRDVDMVLVSHKHSDHLDPGTLPDLMTASHRAQLGLPAPLIDHARSIELDEARLVGLETGQAWGRSGIRVRAVPSAHEALDVDERGRNLYLGFVIEVEGLRLYHSGDCLAYEGLADWLGPDPFDVMFLPINGRDPARGVPGNMSIAEAVDLACRVRPRFVVPHHYDMFTFNTASVADFEIEAERLPVGVRPRVLSCAERWVVERG